MGSWNTIKKIIMYFIIYSPPSKNIMLVMQRLGHRSITSTIIYTHLVSFEGDEYHTATSKSLEEDEELLKAGFEYVTERDEVKIYRKRK